MLSHSEATRLLIARLLSYFAVPVCNTTLSVFFLSLCTTTGATTWTPPLFQLKTLLWINADLWCWREAALFLLLPPLFLSTPSFTTLPPPRRPSLVPLHLPATRPVTQSQWKELHSSWQDEPSLLANSKHKIEAPKRRDTGGVSQRRCRWWWWWWWEMSDWEINWSFTGAPWATRQWKNSINRSWLSPPNLLRRCAEWWRRWSGLRPNVWYASARIVSHASQGEVPAELPGTEEWGAVQEVLLH